MTTSSSFTYLGKTDKGYSIWEGLFTFEAADEYDRDARPSLTFYGVSAVKGVLGVVGYSPGANLGNPVEVLSIATNVVTLMVLETGSGGAGTGLSEKTDGETYGAAGSIRCTIIGL